MSRKKQSNRTEKGGFVRLPHTFTRSYVYSQLSAHAVKLLVDLANQYNGKNNGDLSAPYSVFKDKGWHSKGTLDRAIKELVRWGVIEVTRKGQRRMCSLYALTFHAIDECKSKHDAKATERPKSQWRLHEPIEDIRDARKRKDEMDDKQLAKVILNRAKRQIKNAQQSHMGV